MLLMITSQQLLRAYVQLVRRASRAGIVSLYLPSSQTPPGQPILLHDGTPPALPELANEEAAERFTARVAAAKSGQETSPTRIESQLAAGVLIRVPTIESLLSFDADARPTRERRNLAELHGVAGSAWLGLRMNGSRAGDIQDFSALFNPAGDRESWTWMLAVGGALAWHDRRVSTMVNDPVSQLPGRNAAQEMLRQAMHRASKSGNTVGLLLANPDHFVVVNQRFGREAGDTAIREIAARVRSRLRPEDFICRYGGAIFGVLVADAVPDAVSAAASRLRPALTEEAYLDGAVRLGFSFGVATLTPTRDEDAEAAALTLIRRADSALNAAKLAGGGQIVSWQPGAKFEEIGQHDRLSGIFTANLTKDYRNMLLLWDTVGIVASNPDFDALAHDVLRKLASAFQPDRLALFEQVEEGNPRLRHGLERQTGDGKLDEPTEDPTFHLDHLSLLQEALDTGLPAHGTGDGRVGYAFSLTADSRCLGALYMEGREEPFSVDASDLIFLKGLADQLAVSLDRARLLEQDKLRQEQESQRLRHELEELREALEQQQLVHCSKGMDSLFTTLRQVAPTDATVLITGESGTGKELIARTVHQLSRRRHKPMVVIDCTAIATSLMESELFGHEKGAYTGADRRSAGRLAEADGGTIVLDEIGELPLQVQSKLLRFVQERQYTPVGSSKPLEVDARVVAVTNRDLTTEVAAGRFREDLYHRLNVVRLVVPPLRERPEDILLLSQYFLKKFSVQHQKRIQGLTPEAKSALLSYSWPGNVRELQNRMLQATILCEGDHVGLDEVDVSRVESGRPSVQFVRDVPPAGAPTERNPEEAWAALQSELAERIRVAVTDPALRLPLGKWTGEDLVLEAFAASNGVFSSAAALLGIPETTFRRRMHKVRAKAETGLGGRPAEWDAAGSCIRNVVRSANGGGEDLLKRARAVLLQEIVCQLPDDIKLGSLFLGVTEPTFRRWRAKLLVSAAG